MNFIQNKFFKSIAVLWAALSLSIFTILLIFTKNENFFTLFLLSFLFITFFCVIFLKFINKLNLNFLKFSNSLLSSNANLLELLGSVVASRDSDSNEHNYRVALYSIYLAEKIHFPQNKIKSLIAGSFLHDIGIVGVPDNILLKNGRLTDDEYAVVKQHVNIGAGMIQKSSWLKGAKKVIQYHHERYDGKGYMSGLKGDKIPIEARIFTIVDAFDSLVSKRPYREAYSPKVAMEVMLGESGKQFDPAILIVFAKYYMSWYEETQKSTREELEDILSKKIAVYFFSNAGLESPSKTSK